MTRIYSAMSAHDAWLAIGRIYAVTHGNADRNAFIDGFGFRRRSDGHSDASAKTLGIYPGNQNARIAWDAGWETADGQHDHEAPYE